MRSLLLGVVFLTLTVVPCLNVFAQSPEMSVPLMVLKDADGKTIAQIADLRLQDTDAPWIVLNIDGVPAMFQVFFQDGRIVSKRVYFSEMGCTGDPYIQEPGSSTWLEKQTDTSFGVVGPDPGDGTYRMFRSTSSDYVAAFPFSHWSIGKCNPMTGEAMPLFAAEEITPNPLEGFHGPTTANPERLLTVDGGTRLP